MFQKQSNSNTERITLHQNTGSQFLAVPKILLKVPHILPSKDKSRTEYFLHRDVKTIHRDQRCHNNPSMPPSATEIKIHSSLGKRIITYSSGNAVNHPKNKQHAYKISFAFLRIAYHDVSERRFVELDRKCSGDSGMSSGLRNIAMKEQEAEEKRSQGKQRKKKMKKTQQS